MACVMSSTKQNSVLISSLNKYFVCDYCTRKFKNKQVLTAHILTCIELRTCTLCNIVFKNRGNLVSHVRFNHKKNDNFDAFSSLNKFYTCDHCSKKFHNKFILIKHLDKCIDSRTCKWCNLVFKNRGNLVTHAFHVHGDKSIKRRSKQNTEKMTCKACKKTFSEYCRLKYHIRSVHFNLQPMISVRDNKKINQTWFEEVLNTNTIVQIKKTGHNALLIKRYDTKKPVNILQRDQQLDLRESYPTYTSRQQIECDVCKQWMLKRDFKLHYKEKHTEKKKHQCNNCNATFKRSYFFVRHVCSKNAVIKKETI